MTALASQIPPSALDDNLPCLRCGYNLRTLATDGRCPECSTPIASSLDTNLLRYAKIATIVFLFSSSYWIFESVHDLITDQRFGKILSIVDWFVFAITIYPLIVLYFFRRTLRKSAAFARQYWHFCSPVAQANF